MTIRRTQAVLLALTSLPFLPIAAQSNYTIRELTAPGYSYGRAYEVDNFDRIVCEFFAPSGHTQTFVWQNDTATLLPLPVGAVGGSARCISDQGFVGGWTSTPFWEIGACWKPVGGGAWAHIDMGVAPGDVISEVKQIRGYRATGYSDNGIFQRPVVWPDISIGTSPVLLPYPSDQYNGGIASAVKFDGGVVGSLHTNFGGVRAVEWKEFGGVWSFQFLPGFGPFYSYAEDVVSTGHFVGSAYSPTTNRIHLVEWIGGAIGDLGTITGMDCFAEAANANGDIVGFGQTFSSPPFIAIHKPQGQPVIDLNSMRPPQSPWELVRATGVNDRGVIVGQGVINGFYEPFALIPTIVTLSLPTPGVAGVNNKFTLTGLSPGGTVRLYLGPTGGSSVVSGCLEGLDIALPRIIGTGTADPAGVASISVSVPTALAGVQVFLQAFDHSACHTSNVVVHTF